MARVRNGSGLDYENSTEIRGGGARKRITGAPTEWMGKPGSDGPGPLVSASQFAEDQEENEKTDQKRECEQYPAHDKGNQNGDQHPLDNMPASGGLEDNDGVDAIERRGPLATLEERQALDHLRAGRCGFDTKPRGWRASLPHRKLPFIP